MTDKEAPATGLVDRIMEKIEDVMIDADVDYPAGREVGPRVSYDDDAIRNYISAALQAPQEAGVSVKALEWEEDLESICTRATANALGGKMIVVELDPGSGDYSAGIDLGGLCFRLIQDAYHDDRGVPYSAPAKFSTIEAAKAAAQADFEARILSQIISQPAARQGIATTAPFTFSRYINGQLMAEGVTIERQATIEGAAREAARIASRGPNGEVPVLVLIAPEALSQPVATPSPSQDAAVTETELMRFLVRELGGYSVTIIRDGKRMVGWCTGKAGNSIAMSDILAATRPAPSQGAAVGLRDAEAMAWIFERAEVWTPSADTTRMNGPSVAATIRWLIAATRPAEAKAVAEGWKLVPVEPTMTMLNAAIDTDPYKLGDISPLGFRMSPQSMFDRAWRSMLAASPATGGA
jgi:hypothetical protein